VPGDFVPGSAPGDFVSGSGSRDFVSGSGPGHLVPGSGPGYKARHYDVHVLPDTMPDGGNAGSCSGS